MTSGLKGLYLPTEKKALDIPFIQTYHHRIKQYYDTCGPNKINKRQFLSKRKFYGTVDKGKK
jgi:hypothetical protein